MSFLGALEQLPTVLGQFPLFDLKDTLDSKPPEVGHAHFYFAPI
jgi:hypothetical protein